MQNSCERLLRTLSAHWWFAVLMDSTPTMCRF